VAISPDGRHVAYAITASGQGSNPTLQKTYLRSLGELEAKLLPIGGSPFFSPDGRWIGFLGGAPGSMQIRKVGLGGGAPATVCNVDSPAGFAWADDDTIYFVGAVPGGVMRVPAAGGPPNEVAKIDFAKGERTHRYPCALPGSNAVLFTVTTPDADTFDDARISVVNVATGQRKTVVEGGTHPRYSPSGHLVYARGGNLLAIRFDPKRLEATGQPFIVLEGVVMSRNSGVANFDISASGDLVYAPGEADKGERTLVWVDRNGKAEPLPLPPRSYLHPRLSPDSHQLAVEIEGPNHDFYIYDFARAVLSKMTTDGVSHWPVWSPDGAKLVYRSGPMMAWRMWQIPADRSRSPEQLPGTGLSQNAESWSPDGHAIAYTALTHEAGSHIMVESLEGSGQSHPFADTKASAGSPKFSPDGRRLAYCSNESGKEQAYVQAFPGPGPKIQVSNDGGTDPVWKKSGGELYFRNGDKMMAVSVSTAPTFTAGRPQVLWEGHHSHGMSTSCGPPGATSSNYDVTTDGRRFLMVKDEAPDTAFSRQVVVVLGWADEVTRIEKSKGAQS
jgi:serine/threonine-protein kinase